jgi:hypothetical protein
MSKTINKEKPWSILDDKLLLKLHDGGKSNAFIAEQLDRSEKNVSDRIKAIFENMDHSLSDESNFPWSNENDKRLLYLYERKISIGEISKDLMRSELDIIKRLLEKKFADGDSEFETLSNTEQKELIRLYREGSEIQYLAEYFKKSEKTILTIIYQIFTGNVVSNTDLWTKEEEKEMFTLFFSGFKLNEISKSLKKPKNNILRHMRELCEEMQAKFSYDDKKILELTGFDLSRGRKAHRNADE